MAVSPIDGRYATKVDPLRPIASEWGLMRLRVEVELAWLKALAVHPQIAEVPSLSANAQQMLDQIVIAFSPADGERIKAIEATTNHDVKAIEYFLKERFIGHPELSAIAEFVHFACTRKISTTSPTASCWLVCATSLYPPSMDYLRHSSTMQSNGHTIRCYLAPMGSPRAQQQLAKNLPILRIDCVVAATNLLTLP